jgi:hypothetical protein
MQRAGMRRLFGFIILVAIVLATGLGALGPLPGAF